MLRHALLACGIETPVTRRRSIQVVGQVIEPLANDMFLVRLDSGQQIRAHLTGGMKTKIVRILPGERVEIEISDLDLSRGRIIGRLQT
jgi:translation initiation factor IF-1